MNGEWISIDKDKPEQGKRVLIYQPTSDWLFIGYLDGFTWVGDSNGRTFSGDTYWMPLPDLPGTIHEREKIRVTVVKADAPDGSFRHTWSLLAVLLEEKSRDEVCQWVGRNCTLKAE